MNVSTSVIAPAVIVLLGGLMLIWWWTSRPTLSGGLRALLRIVAIPVFIGSRSRDNSQGGGHYAIRNDDG